MRRRPPRRIRGIIYPQDVEEKNREKHGVTRDEVRELFLASPLFFYQEKGRRAGEDLYHAAGQLANGRYLIAFFIHKSTGEALVLSVRDMTLAERRRYEARKKHRPQSR